MGRELKSGHNHPLLKSIRLVLPVWLTAACSISCAGAYPETSKLLVNSVTAACKEKNEEKFLEFYCKNADISHIPAFFLRPMRFTEVGLRPAGMGEELHLCAEPPGTKEMCQVFRVVQSSEGLCIDPNLRHQ